MNNQTLPTSTLAVNQKNSESTGARSLAYFKNRQRDADLWGNWRRDLATDTLIFNGGWYVDLDEVRDAAAAFHAMADFAKFAISADDVADLGRAIRKTVPGVLS